MLTFTIVLLLIGVVLFLFMVQLLKHTRQYSFRSSGVSKRRRTALQSGVVSLICILVGALLIIFNLK
jgi:hypothetical protein